MVKSGYNQNSSSGNKNWNLIRINRSVILSLKGEKKEIEQIFCKTYKKTIGHNKCDRFYGIDCYILSKETDSELLYCEYKKINKGIKFKKQEEDKMKYIMVENLEGAKNQFLIHTPEGLYFQSYDSLIAFKGFENMNAEEYTYLDNWINWNSHSATM